VWGPGRCGVGGIRANFGLSGVRIVFFLSEGIVWAASVLWSAATATVVAFTFPRFCSGVLLNWDCALGEFMRFLALRVQQPIVRMGANALIWCRRVSGLNFG